MRIAIIGSGTMGSALGRAFAAANHRVTFTFSRDPEKLARLAKSVGRNARAASPAEAVRDAAVVVLAVHWQQLAQAIRLAGNLRGKIVIDASNPLNTSEDALAVGFRRSGAETLAKKARGAHVVKAFNTIPAELLDAGVDVLSEMPSALYCGDGAKAMRVVARLAKQIGFEPVDCGALVNARYLEPLAMLVGELAYNQGRRPEIGLRVLRRASRK